MKRLLLSLAFVGIFVSSGNPLMAMKKNTKAETLKRFLITAPKNGLTSIFAAITGMPSATKGFYKKYVHNLGCDEQYSESSPKPLRARINEFASGFTSVNLSDAATLLAACGLGYLTLVKYRATSKKVSLSTLNFLGRSTSKGLNLAKYGIKRTSNAIANYTK